ncbi:MAG TPA: ATP-binding protein [Pyrinomonadaceae bacterium]
MGIRPKLFLVFFACGIVPMLVFAVLNYLSGVRAVEDLLRRDGEREARAAANSIESALLDREAELVALSRSLSLRDYVSNAAKQQTASASTTQFRPEAPQTGSTAAPSSVSPDGGAGAQIPPEVRVEVEAFLLNNRSGYVALACLDANRKPLFRAEVAQPATNVSSVNYQTSDFLPNDIAPNETVWTTAEQTPLRSVLSRESSGTIIRQTTPLFMANASAQAPRGALVVDLKLSKLCKAAIVNFVDGGSESRLFVVLDGGGNVVFYNNEALLHRPVMNIMPPSFKTIADAMLAGESGQKSFDSPENERWLVSYQPVRATGVSLGIANNETAALRGVRRAGWLSIILSALAGLLTAVLLTLIARRMERSIERVTEGAVAIAGGRLDQRIEVRSSDETRLLAESFNQMTDRLHEQIAHEAETKQFESFMRLAAMLTHDLKNSITALSLVVSNMEQQFDREEFRAEAMESLKESTDKLRSLVAKLSGPVESLSGEYKRPRPTDLVPHIKRVLRGTAEQAERQHQVEVRLPSTLVASVDAERIERVFENLILNALEAMGTQSGTLTIEAGPENEGEIFFSVADTGPGISEEFRRTRLFRPFATTKRKGVGLGLYTCREVVHAHGGRIEVKSEQGAGATFRVVLPSARFAGA